MKLSIIIPSYNSGKYLGKCLKSIFNQSYQNFEVIVIDGHSSDRSREILKHYSLCENFRCELREPQGEYDAINAGMKLATGDVVAYLDADDTYEPECFERVVQAFRQNPDTLWLYGKGKIIDKEGHESRGIVTTVKKLFWPMRSYRALQCFNYIVQPATFMRKTFHSKVGMFDTQLKYDADYEYWLRAWTMSPPLFLNKHLANWRAHDEALSIKEYKPEAKEAFKIQKLYSEWWLRPAQWAVCQLTILLYWAIGSK